MSVGKYTYGMPEIHTWINKNKLIIGNFCSIGAKVHVYLDGNHRTD